MGKKRFSDIKSSEYDLALPAMPGGVKGYYEYQQLIAQACHDLLKDKFLDQKELTILEAGCGNGHTTRELLQSNERFVITAVDDEPVMIAEAKGRLREYASRVNWVDQDILPFLKTQPQNSFEGFVSGFTLHNLIPEERKSVAKEIGQVVKPGGVYVNGDKIARNNPLAHQRDLEEDIRELKKISRKDIGQAWIDHDLEDDLIRFTEAEQEQLLQDNGFQNITFSHRQRMWIIVTATKTDLT